MSTKLSRSTLRYNNDRQKELMRVVLAKFADYERRGQHYFGLEGMSTSHLTLKCIEDLSTLHAFWPAEHQRFERGLGNLYMMADDTMTRVQSAIRDELAKLAKKGYLQKVGNENERRWLPAKDLLVEIRADHGHAK